MQARYASKLGLWSWSSGNVYNDFINRKFEVYAKSHDKLFSVQRFCWGAFIAGYIEIFIISRHLSDICIYKSFIIYQGIFKSLMSHRIKEGIFDSPLASAMGLSRESGRGGTAS